MAIIHFDAAQRDLPRQGLVGAQEQLLACLTARVEGAADLNAAEGAVVEQAAVVACEGDALGDGLVDDSRADFRQAVNVGLAGAVVAPLDGIVKEPVDAVAVVGVILGGVDAALSGDAMRPARTVVEGESLDLVAQLAQRGCRRRAGQAGTDDDDLDASFIVGSHQVHRGAVLRPLFIQGAGRCFAVKFHMVSIYDDNL